jgi:hypothetical protein
MRSPRSAPFYWHFEDPAEQEAFRGFAPASSPRSRCSAPASSPRRCRPARPRRDLLHHPPGRQLHRRAAPTQTRRPLRRPRPYGNGFPMEAYRGKNLVFVAGGIGLIPALLHHLRPRPPPRIPAHPDLLRCQDTARTHVPREPREWERRGASECHLTVDRGAEGWAGTSASSAVSVRKPGVQVPVDNTIAFVCGPPVMFRFVIKDLSAWDSPKETSSRPSNAT